MDSKHTVRQQLRNVTKTLAHSSFLQEDSASVSAFLASPLYQQCSLLFAFVPLSDEVDITPILHHAFTHKSLALPKCSEERLTFFTVREGWETTLQKSSLGVAEPSGGLPALVEGHSLLLVPAMAYTAKGERLGRGKGYYDRFLYQNPSLMSIGICRRHQLLTSLPIEERDINVQQVLCNGVFIIP